jgi:hypothetical protein
VDLVRDLLDKKLLDRRDRPAGRVDGILAEWRPGEPLRLTHLEAGGVTLARRLSPRLGRWVRRLARRISPARGRAWRIPLSRVKEIGLAVRVSADARRTPVMAWERWLRRKVMSHIPGA